MKYIFSLSFLILGAILVLADLFANQNGGGFGAIISLVALLWISVITKNNTTKWLKPLLCILVLLFACFLTVFLLSGRSLIYGW